MKTSYGMAILTMAVGILLGYAAASGKATPSRSVDPSVGDKNLGYATGPFDKNGRSGVL